MLCSSYSGTTEETLSAYDDAVERGAPRLVATTGGALAERARRDGVPVIPIPGGFQPRAAVGYALVVGAGGGGAVRRRAVAARRGRGGRRAGRGARAPSGARTAPRTARRRRSRARLHGTVPVIAGAELAAAAAYRWKCQFNENAGLPAFAGALPEIDHNEVVGWAAARALGRFSAVFLEDPGAHPRNVAAHRADRGAGARPAPTSSSASRRAATRRSSGSSRSCCSATSSRSTSPCCAARTRSTSRRSTR